MRAPHDFNNLVAGGLEQERRRICRRGHRTGRGRSRDRAILGSLVANQEGRSASDDLIMRVPAPHDAGVRAAPVPEGNTLSSSLGISITAPISTMLIWISTSLTTLTTLCSSPTTVSGVISTSYSPDVTTRKSELTPAISLPETALPISSRSSPLSSSTPGKAMSITVATGVAAGIAVAISLALVGFLLHRCLRGRAMRNREIAFPQRVTPQSIWGAEGGSPVPSPRNSMRRGPFRNQRSHKPSSLTFPSIYRHLDTSTKDSVFNKPELYTTSTLSKPEPLKTRTINHTLKRSSSSGGVMNSKVFIRPLQAKNMGFDVPKGEGVWVTQARPLTPTQAQLRNFKFGIPENKTFGIRTKTRPPISSNRTTWSSTTLEIINEYNPIPLPPTYPYNTFVLDGGSKIPNEISAFDLATPTYASTSDGGIASPGDQSVPSPLRMRSDVRKMVGRDVDSDYDAFLNSPYLTWAKEQTRLNRLRATGEFEERRRV